MGDKLITITIDPTPHSEKPGSAETAVITRRLQAAGPSTVTFEELEAVILDGGTVCCGCFEPRGNAWGPFVGMQLFMLDFDDPDRLDPLAALDRCHELNLPPAFVYFTFSATV